MLKWGNYFLRSDKDFKGFWNDYQIAKKPDILFIMGMGFDPRTNIAIQTIYLFKSDKKRDTILLRYFKNEDEIENTPTKEVRNHISALESFLKDMKYPPPQQKNIFLRSPDDKSITSISATNIIESISEFEQYSDIVIDISAMPRSIFIPLLNKCLDIIERHNSTEINKKNLHVVVTENSALDALIYDQGADEEATYIHGFRIKEIDKTKDQKEVWIPILGEKQLHQFEKVQSKLSPVEICPILPFPSENLRRGDNLIIEYQDVLFNDSDFETKNIVYVDEANPFQTYRRLYKLIERYDKSFELLNGCKIIVSALSSKLLTVGAFLAVYEKKKDNKNVGIMHVESIGHKLDENFEEFKIEVEKHHKLFELWLAGEPYNE